MCIRDSSYTALFGQLYSRYFFAFPLRSFSKTSLSLNVVVLRAKNPYLEFSVHDCLCSVGYNAPKVLRAKLTQRDSLEYLKTSRIPNVTIRSPAISLIYRADFILHSSA